MDRKQASYISIATAIAVAISALSGGMWLGVQANEIQTLKEAAKLQKKDHDKIITIEADVKHIREDVGDIKKILEILEKRSDGKD